MFTSFALRTAPGGAPYYKDYTTFRARLSGGEEMDILQDRVGKLHRFENGYTLVPITDNDYYYKSVMKNLPK